MMLAMFAPINMVVKKIQEHCIRKISQIKY